MTFNPSCFPVVSIIKLSSLMTSVIGSSAWVSLLGITVMSGSRFIISFSPSMLIFCSLIVVKLAGGAHNKCISSDVTLSAVRFCGADGTVTKTKKNVNIFTTDLFF